MMALSDRFSSLPYFEGTINKDRGSQFANKAQAIHHEIYGNPRQPRASLAWLQGNILLAYYNQSTRPTMECDLLIAECIRQAHDLGLHMIDEDEQVAVDSSSFHILPEEWTAKEGQRRAWWAVWELDAFDSVSSRHSFKIDRNRMCVFLPVSDEAWFVGTPVGSAMLSSDILQC